MLQLSFPYVCPEPVLVKSSFLYINGSKRPFVLTGVGRVHQTLEETFKEVGGHRLPLRRKRLFFSVSGCLSRACLGKRSVSLVETGCKKRRFPHRVLPTNQPELALA